MNECFRSTTKVSWARKVPGEPRDDESAQVRAILERYS